MKKLLTDLYRNKLRTKEPKERTSFNDDSIIGWLELDNNFFFFKDKDAFDQLVKLIKSKL